MGLVKLTYLMFEMSSLYVNQCHVFETKYGWVLLAFN